MTTVSESARPARSRRVRSGSANIRITPSPGGGYEVRIGSADRARLIGTITRPKGGWMWRRYEVRPSTVDAYGLPTGRLARRTRRVDGDLNVAAYATVGAYLGWPETVTDIAALTWRPGDDGLGMLGAAGRSGMVWAARPVSHDAAGDLADLLDVPLRTA